MADYRIETRLRDGTYVQTLPHRNLQYEIGRNKPYGCRFDVPLYHRAVTSSTIVPGLHEIWVWRNGVLVKAGPLWDVTPSSSDKSLNCSAMDLLDYFDTRLTHAQNYATIDQVLIAWNLVNYTQGLTNGDLGIIMGTLGTGITRSATWKDYDNKYILEAITDISEMVQGFDFDIDPATRAFNAFYPRPQTNRNLALYYPQQIRHYSVQYWGKYMRNVVQVQGVDPNLSVAVDTTSRSTYGLREYADSYRDAQLITDLNNYAGKIRDQRKDVKAYPTVSLQQDFIDMFNSNIIQLGDLLRVVIQDGYVNIDTTLRYQTAQITVDKQGSEAVVLYLQDQRELN